MTTPQPSSPQHSRQRHGGRATTWLGGWRLALRMARREVRRDRLRAVFVWLMVALPVGAICGFQVFLASSDLSSGEQTELRLGGNQAALTLGELGFAPEFDGGGTASIGVETWPATPIPGWGATTAERQRAVEDLTGRPALAITLGEAVRVDGSAALVLGVDTSRPESAGVVRLTDGRLPAATAEVLVTASGVVSGLPVGGTLTLRNDAGQPYEVTVVGTANVRQYEIPDLIAAPDPDPATVAAFLLGGDQPVTWEDAVRFAGYGFMTASRHFLEHPPEVPFEPSSENVVRFYTSLLLISAALLEVMLVVGPAFAIGAARQRRSLALAASNGATPAQLRRSALGQAVLLGVSAAVVGATLGTLVGVVSWPLFSADPTQPHGPLEIPLVSLALTLALVIVATVLAALVAARGLGRLDLVSALRGSLRPSRERRGAPVWGASLVVTGLALNWSIGTAIQVDPSLWFILWCVGAVAVLVGALLLVPVLLRAISRTGDRAPVAARLALRELARQRGRTRSAVAAIMAGAVVLGVLWTIVLTQQLDDARHDRMETAYGQATVIYRDMADPDLLLEARAIVATIDPSLHTARTATIRGWAADSAAELEQSLAAVNPGCEPADLIGGISPPVGCKGLNTLGQTPRSETLTGPAEELIDFFRLDASYQGALLGGALLVDTTPWAPSELELPPASTAIVNGEVSFIRFDVDVPESVVAEQVPAVPISTELIERGASPDAVGALISVDAAQERNWRLGGWQLRVNSPDGPITPELEARLALALQRGGFSISVERGWEPRPQPVVWGMTGAVGLLAIVAAALTAILGVAELRPFLATFAAVGADPWLSRRLASTQAWLLGFVGSALGASVGLAVGAPTARLTTSSEGRLPALLVLPWQLLLVLVVVVPLVAAGVARLAVPSGPTLVRRVS